MIALLLLYSLNAFAFESVEVDYVNGDKHVVHSIDAKGLKIGSGASSLQRKLSADDYKWIEEKIAVLKKQSAKECVEDATIEIKQKGQASFVVCGDSKDARDFLSVIALK